MHWKNEIGSEFWDVPLCEIKNHLFPDCVHWYISGRSALCSIIHDLPGCKSIALPSWCCESIIKPFIDAGIKVVFYSVFWDKKLVVNPIFLCDAILVMDYFGDTSVEVNLQGYNGIVIRDVTHSVFSKKHYDADYYFGSIRKWCGIWTGGYAWTNDSHKLENGNRVDKKYVSLRKKAMLEKKETITKNANDKNYLSIFDEAEDYLDLIGVSTADERDIKLVEYIDVDFIVKRRQTNAKILMNSFVDWLIFPSIKETDCPMFVPVIVPKNLRNQLRSYLIENSVYFPVHWPLSKYHCIDSKSMYIYQNELSLVCDQRYDKEDMFRIVNLIEKFLEKR